MRPLNQSESDAPSLQHRVSYRKTGPPRVPSLSNSRLGIGPGRFRLEKIPARDDRGCRMGQTWGRMCPPTRTFPISFGPATRGDR